MRPLAMAVNEATVFDFWRRTRRGEHVYVLAVEPMLPLVGRVIHGIVERAYAAGKAESARALCPEFAHLLRHSNLTSLYDIFARIEPWQNRRYRFAHADGDPRHGMVFKQTTGKYLQDKYTQILMANAVAEKNVADITGMQRDTAELYEAYCGNPPPGRVVGFGPFAPAVNALGALAVASFSLLWLLTRLRPRVGTEDIFLAADFLKDPRDVPLYRIAEAGGPVLLVGRNPDFTPRDIPELKGLRFCLPGDGRVSPGAAIRFAGRALADAVDVWRRYGWTEPALFWRLVTRVHYRVTVRALLMRFRVRFYWGRDEYNADHILRHQEVKAQGGKTMGLMHGIQGLADLNPRRRYVAFDIFYVFGRHLYDKYYKDTWLSGMTVRPIGSFAFTREELAAADWRASRQIVVFASIAIGLPELIRAIRAVAGAFPDCRLQVKNKEPLKNRLPERQAFIRACSEGLANVEFVGDVSAAGLIARARFVLSDASTVIAESIHCGIPTVMLDVVPGHRTCLFRDFPGLCVGNAESAVVRLRDYDHGRAVFRRQDYDGLIDLSGRHYHDVLRQDLGL